MGPLQKPSTVLYSTLKACGVSNRIAAETLLDSSADCAGRPVSELLASKSQLSRRIVHASPGDIPASCFVDWLESIPVIASMLLDRYALDNCEGNMGQGARNLIDGEIARAHKGMAEALAECGTGAAMYREAVDGIERLDLNDAGTLVTLHLIVLVVAGCTGDGQAALANVVAYASEDLGLDYRTPQPHTPEPDCESGEAKREGATFSIVRVRDGVIAAGAKLHPVTEDGLTVGLLPREENAAADVDADVSLRHARLWVEAGKLFIEDLGSTNGTTVASPGSEEVSIADEADPTELRYGDEIRLGATTRFIVLPNVASDTKV